MITEKDYQDYFGVDTAPSNLARLEFLSLSTFKSVPIKMIPGKGCPLYDTFKKALMEQINFYDLNEDLITSNGSDGYTLGSYSESASNNEAYKSINRLSSAAYDILLSCGLISSSLGGCYCG
jgi:hypothetical protein